MGLREKLGCLFMIISVIIMMGFGYEVSGCFEDEKQALFDLKSVFEFGEGYLPSWSINEDENRDDCYCHGWEGVICGPNGRLISLSLPSRYEYTILKVDFNASILLPFRDLRELNLSENGILTWTEQTKGSIKLSSSLTKLEILDLTFNYLDRGILQHLSGFYSLRKVFLSENHIKGYIQLNDFEAMKNLEELDLSDNHITSFLNYNEIKNLPTMILPKLEFLDLSWNKELGSNVTVLSIASALVPSLKHLKLSSVGLNGQIKLDETKNLPTRLLPKLEFLDLSSNEELGSNIIVTVASALPSLKHLMLYNTGLNGQIKLDDFEPMKNLEELDLSGNNITSFLNYNETKNLPTRLLPKLEFLDLTGNEELGSNVTVRSIASALPSLKHLKLPRVGFYGQIKVDDFEPMKNLEELDLSYNDITSFLNYNGCGQMQKLQKLDLSVNALRAVPSCLANLSSLQTLDLSWNQITGSIASSPLIHLHSLKSLSIISNKIQIPDSFSAFQNHTKLKYFLASSNQVIVDNSNQDVHPLAVGHGLQLEVLDLSDCRVPTHPSFLHHQHNLRAVDLSDNLMEGNFSKWLLENNLQLEELYMRNNSLSGELQLPSLTHNHLSVLDISRNNFSGYIPPNISTLFPRLSVLDMSDNGFSGDIPFSLFDIESLKSLKLSGNSLSGGFWNSTRSHSHSQLRELILSFNKFEGELPPFYGFLSLKILDLQGNNFSGSIQPNMFNASLVVLNLSNNSLQGPIPKDFCRFDGLVVLDLSYNMLNGSMQPCLLNLSMINLLSLNNNKLSGGIDDRLEYSSLSSLDLSHNDLDGEVPASIGNFTCLGALILKGNQFNGVIPIQLCKLRWLGILDLSNNNLSGQIPSCLSNMAIGGGNTFEYFFSNEVGDNPSYGNLMQRPQGYDVKGRLTFTTKSMSYIYKGGSLRIMFGLDLSCNRLSGEIPHEIGNLSNLQALNLSHNNLHGSIPASFSNLKSIESLDLSYNSLNGSIPAQLLELYSLEVFKVAYNNLSGQVPLTAQFATFSASDYEGNLLLCGSPILKSCTPASELPGPIEPNNVKEEEGWMDMDAFYMSFAASSVTMFLAVVVILWINPYWCSVLFYLAKICVLSTYYFIENICRRFRGVRSV